MFLVQGHIIVEQPLLHGGNQDKLTKQRKMKRFGKILTFRVQYGVCVCVLPVICCRSGSNHIVSYSIIYSRLPTDMWMLWISSPFAGAPVDLNSSWSRRAGKVKIWRYQWAVNINTTGSNLKLADNGLGPRFSQWCFLERILPNIAWHFASCHVIHPAWSPMGMAQCFQRWTLISIGLFMRTSNIHPTNADVKLHALSLSIGLLLVGG